MNNNLKLVICLVMVTALALMTVLFLDYQALGTDLRNTELQLTESREAWEKIASDKEAIQSDLKAKQKEIKETQLQLDEAVTRSEELKQDILLLQQAIDELKQGR